MTILVYRNIDPALAFKLEIFRLSNYNIARVSTRSPQIHMYFAAGKVARDQVTLASHPLKSS